jgi:NIMA (never in mitosis gene a)-related kinase
MASNLKQQKAAKEDHTKSDQPTSTLNDFKIISKLGEGAYSVVYKALRIADNQIYALKKVKLLNLNDKEKENALNEVRLLASLGSKYVIKFMESFWDHENSCLCIVMEFADNGDLFQKICLHQKAETQFEEHQIWKVLI